MKIRYTLSRRDLLRANLQIQTRSRFLWFAWAALTLFVSHSWLTDGKYDNRTLGYKITMVVILAIMYLITLFGLTTIVTSIAIILRKHLGVIGEHSLAIEEDGLSEVTDHNVSRSKWSSYHKTRVSGSFAFLYISESHFHLIPLCRPLAEGNAREFLKELKEKTKK
jgi:hypothetical protein